MKIGVRKPSIKKSFKARTTGNLKRKIKKTVNPLYGKKGMGLINSPKKAVYNKVYRKTTISTSDILSHNSKKSDVVNFDQVPQEWLDRVIAYEEEERNTSPVAWKIYSVIMKTLAIITLIVFGLPGLFAGMIPMLIIAVIAALGMWMLGSTFSKKGKEAAKNALEQNTEV